MKSRFIYIYIYIEKLRKTYILTLLKQLKTLWFSFKQKLSFNIMNTFMHIKVECGRLFNGKYISWHHGKPILRVLINIKMLLNLCFVHDYSFPLISPNYPPYMKMRDFFIQIWIVLHHETTKHSWFSDT